MNTKFSRLEIIGVVLSSISLCLSIFSVIVCLTYPPNSYSGFIEISDQAFADDQINDIQQTEEESSNSGKEDKKEAKEKTTTKETKQVKEDTTEKSTENTTKSTKKVDSTEDSEDKKSSKNEEKEEKSEVSTNEDVEFANNFKVQGVINDGTYRYTYYSSKVLYHYRTSEWTAGADGIYRDSDGYVVVASSDNPEGTVITGTPFGDVKVYDCGCPSGTLDVYVNW